MDEQDYGVMLSYIKEYLSLKDKASLLKRLSDPNISTVQRDQVLRTLRLNNFFENITLIAYCLMPNHFHFLIHQKYANDMDKFMNSLGTRYTMYFNKKYERVGKLWQGTYKAVPIETESQLLELTRYIHKQALNLKGVALQGDALMQPCSYPEYIGKRKTVWVQSEEILKFFSKTKQNLLFEAFVEQADDFGIIDKLILEQ